MCSAERTGLLLLLIERLEPLVAHSLAPCSRRVCGPFVRTVFLALLTNIHTPLVALIVLIELEVLKVTRGRGTCTSEASVRKGRE